MKKITLVATMLLWSISGAVRATEIEGDAARQMVIGGKVLGMSLFDDFMKEIFGEKQAGFVYSVLHEDKVWTCYNSRTIGWFCETFE